MVSSAKRISLGIKGTKVKSRNHEDSGKSLLELIVGAHLDFGLSQKNTRLILLRENIYSDFFSSLELTISNRSVIKGGHLNTE